MDGFIIGCFDNTGLEKAREITDKPVIGIGQAAYHMAVMTNERFTVLTTLDVSVPVIKQNIKELGFSIWCDDVVASGVPVLQPRISARNCCAESQAIYQGNKITIS